MTTKILKDFELAKTSIESIKAAFEVIHDAGGDPVIVSIRVEPDLLMLISVHYEEPITGGNCVIIDLPHGFSIHCEIMDVLYKQENAV